MSHEYVSNRPVCYLFVVTCLLSPTTQELSDVEVLWRHISAKPLLRPGGLDL